MTTEIDEWGRVILNHNQAIELMLLDYDLTKLYIKNSPEIEKYNEECYRNNKDDYIIPEIINPSNSPEEEHYKRQTTWFIPKKYSDMDVKKHILNMCDDASEIKRVNLELTLFEDRNLLSVLKLMIYLVDYWRENNIVWGVGRGSSVASYCLFLIGVHKINSLKYDLDINEFLK